MMKNRALLVMTAAACILRPGYAYAAQEGVQNMKSCGSIVYGQNDGTVQIYQDDFALLRDKISSIPDTVFEPGIYTHTHEWTFIDVNGETHTKHCGLCGSAHNMTNGHVPRTKESCDITYDGHTYAGYRYMCECGRQWEREAMHNMAYTPLDEGKHALACVLGGTQYCTGSVTGEEEHIFNLMQSGDGTGNEVTLPVDGSGGDGLHHSYECELCGYWKDEACDFTDHSEAVEEGIRQYCLCGNYIVEEEKNDEAVAGQEEEDQQEEPDDSQPEGGQEDGNQQEEEPDDSQPGGIEEDGNQQEEEPDDSQPEGGQEDGNQQEEEPDDSQPGGIEEDGNQQEEEPDDSQPEGGQEDGNQQEEEPDDSQPGGIEEDGEQQEEEPDDSQPEGGQESGNQQEGDQDDSQENSSQQNENLDNGQRDGGQEGGTVQCKERKGEIMKAMKYFTQISKILKNIK